MSLCQNNFSRNMTPINTCIVNQKFDWETNLNNVYVLVHFNIHLKEVSAYLMIKSWLCLASHRQQGYFGTTPPFTVPCEGHEAKFLHCSHWVLNPGLSRGRPLHNSCTTPAPLIISNSISLWGNKWLFFRGKNISDGIGMHIIYKTTKAIFSSLYLNRSSYFLYIRW